MQEVAAMEGKAYFIPIDTWVVFTFFARYWFQVHNS